MKQPAVYAAGSSVKHAGLGVLVYKWPGQISECWMWGYDRCGAHQGSKLWLCWQHRSYDKFSYPLAIPAGQILQIHTTQRALSWTLTKQRLAFYTAGPTSFLYNGTPLEAVDRFNYLGVILTKDGRLKAASDQMASTFMGTIQRVRKAGSHLHI